jgi:Peptidase M1 N-terminal domain
VLFSFSALLLICALVVVGRGLSARSDKQFAEPTQEISSISLINRAINPNKNTIETSDTKFKKKFDMSLGKMASKLVENLTFRLPAAIRPTSYNLFLNPNLETKTFSGNVKIDFSVSEASPFVAVHSKFLNVTTNKLIRNLENGAEGIAIKSSFEYEKYEYFIVEPETELSVGNYTIDLNFNGSLDGKIVGFYGSSYFDKMRNQTR